MRAFTVGLRSAHGCARRIRIPLAGRCTWRHFQCFENTEHPLHSNNTPHVRSTLSTLSTLRGASRERLERVEHNSHLLLQSSRTQDKNRGSRSMHEGLIILYPALAGAACTRPA